MQEADLRIGKLYDSTRRRKKMRYACVAPSTTIIRFLAVTMAKLSLQGGMTGGVNSGPLSHTKKHSTYMANL